MTARRFQTLRARFARDEQKRPVPQESLALFPLHATRARNRALHERLDAREHAPEREVREGFPRALRAERSQRVHVGKAFFEELAFEVEAPREREHVADRRRHHVHVFHGAEGLHAEVVTVTGQDLARLDRDRFEEGLGVRDLGHER